MSIVLDAREIEGTTDACVSLEESSNTSSGQPVKKEPGRGSHNWEGQLTKSVDALKQKGLRVTDLHEFAVKLYVLQNGEDQRRLIHGRLERQ